MTRSVPILAALVILGSTREASAQVPAREGDPRPLPAPQALAAAPGRGTAILFATDARGNRIAEAPDGAAPRKTPRALRWAVVVGAVDLRALRAAIPGPPPADVGLEWPGKRIDLQRQERLAEGGWSDWSDVDPDANLDILDNLTEIEPERVPPERLTVAFVDPLPSLIAGEWRGADVEALVGDDLRDARRRGAPRRALPAPGAAPARTPMVLVAEVMIRSIDFTVRPGATYRYRARVVAVAPDPRGRVEERPGPWSAPAAEVTIPRD